MKEMRPSKNADLSIRLQTAKRILHKARYKAQKQIKECRWKLTQRNRDLLAMARSEQRHRQFAEALVDATLVLNTSLDQDVVLDCILEQTQRIIPCHAAAIILLRDQAVCVARCRGFESDSAGITDLSSGICINVALPLPSNDTSSESSLLSDISGERLWQFMPGLEWAQSRASVPMQGRESVIGFLGVFSKRANAFDPESLGFLQAFAAHAVLAIQNTALYASTVQARQVAETLSSASLALTRTLDLDTVLHTLLEYLSQLVPYDDAYVMLLQDQTHLALEAAHSREQQTDVQEGRTRRIDADRIPFVREILTTRAGRLIPDTAAYPGWEHPAGWRQMGSWLGIPLVAEAGVIGVCGLGKDEPGFYTQAHLELATALVRQAAVAVQNARLFAQVSEARKRLQALSQRLVEVQEAERRYIARELHDEAGQALTSLAVGLRLLEREANQSETFIAEVNELSRTVESVSEDLHRLATALRPPSLDHLGLVAALRQYVESISQKHDLVVQFEAIGLDKRRPVDLETALYRIVQEALTNVIRHARATRVEVKLQQFQDKLLVSVEDDGVGFDLDTQPTGEHLGLIGIQERAEMLGGKLTLKSATSGGTTLLVEVPYAIADTHR